MLKIFRSAHSILVDTAVFLTVYLTLNWLALPCFLALLQHIAPQWENLPEALKM